MSQLSRSLQFELSCPACPDSYAVPLEIIEESQRLLDEVGPCTGMASYECPAQYFAGLVTTEAIAHLETALHEVEHDALRHHARLMWSEHDSGVPAAATPEKESVPSRREDVRAEDLFGAARRRIDDERALVRAVERWEGEGGALGRH